VLAFSSFSLKIEHRPEAVKDNFWSDVQN